MRRALHTLNAQRPPLPKAAAQRETLHQLKLKTEFDAELRQAGLWPLRPTKVEVLQVNVGKLCNQSCRHCHVDAGPERREMMTRDTFELCLKALANSHIPTVDITGGAPELVQDFRWFVAQCRGLGRHVIDRCNLTIIETPGHRDLPEFLAAHQVEVICSLPHYRQLNTDKQRGEGVYAKSIQALKKLNAVGYGRHPELQLQLVANPVGAFLPGAQASLEREWKQGLKALHQIDFNNLYTITNMPISRYLAWLLTSQNLEAYMERLVNAFNPAAARGLMCRHTISVGYDGQLYDCDFNQMLELPIDSPARHIRDWDFSSLEQREIVVGRHCFGCSAGAGSSCGGTTT